MVDTPTSGTFPTARAAKIRLLLVDVDGTLTDGGLYSFSGGLFGAWRSVGAVRFHVRDGLGLHLARRAGLVVGIISGRPTPAARRRARELMLDEIHLGVADKKTVLQEILARRRIAPEEACFVGDDVVDLPAMMLCGLPVAVADAHGDVRAAALWVTTLPGGHGAVREVVDRILGAQKKP